MRRASMGFALAGALLAAPGRAEGESFDGKVFLDWSADAGATSCVTREQIIADVEASLGRQVFARRAVADRVLRVDVGGAPPAKLTGQILLLTANGVSLGARELSVDADDCKDAASALTLALSIMADLPRTSAERAAETKAPSAPPPPPVTRAPPLRWHAAVGLGPMGSLDSQGDLSGGAQATAVFVPPRFLPFSVTIFASPRSSSSPSGMGYTLLNTTVAATICAPAWSHGHFAWLGCIGPDVTLYAGWGAGFTQSHAGLSSTVGGLAHTYAAYSFARGWRAVVGLGAAASPQRVSLAFTDRQNTSTTFYRTPFVSAFTAIGVAVDLF
ncbi:MAG: hypothetical protein JWO86_242 [Myxococcaceae bacterium]|nr:hypothetical protein [Myxococcaceae bacterium]